jgi:4-alpha-glucanotransferase
VPGAPSAADELEGLGALGRALNDERVIRRDAVRKLKLSALELLWDRWPGDHGFDEFCRRGGDALEKFATFAALAEAYGDDWRAWPTSLRRPENGAVVREARHRRPRVDFHKWLQWLLERQLAKASRSVALVGDLAIGVNPLGFDAWLWQDVFASRVSIGAPPDDFNLGGQDWSLAAFDPWRLRAAGYEPFIAMLRSAFRHVGGLRFDHVMGLWRLFWIPEGATTPASGAYVRYPAKDLLAILALESVRAGAFVIGEDLGTVEKGVREEMARRDLLSYRLLCFEQSDPSAYPAGALAAVTNHDLPTLPGLWRRDGGPAASGPSPNEAFEEAVRERVRRITGLDVTADVADAVAATYRALAGAPSVLIAATLEDALGVSEQPNRPGSTEEVPNWSLALPASLEEILEDPGPRRLARILRRRKGKSESAPAGSHYYGGGAADGGSPQSNQEA